SAAAARPDPRRGEPALLRIHRSRALRNALLRRLRRPYTPAALRELRPRRAAALARVRPTGAPRTHRHDARRLLAMDVPGSPNRDAPERRPGALFRWRHRSRH